MTMRTDMAAKCEECKKRPAFGEVAITPAHYAEAAGTTLEQKYEDLKNKAALGCCDGTDCFRAESEIVTRNENGQDVEYMVSRCGDDPNSLRGELIDS